MSNDMMAISDNVLSGCKSCLDACLLHILNLRGFAHTVLVDTWICSLSYVIYRMLLFPSTRPAIANQELSA